LIAYLDGQGSKERQAGAAGSTAAPPAWNGGREGEHGRKEKRPDKWGHPVSDSRKKEKGKRKVGRRAVAGEGRWPVAGWAGKEGRSFFPFLFSFKTLFKFKPFQFKTFQKLFKLFSQKILNLSNLTQATKNHA
jgi:hypothetical protein